MVRCPKCNRTYENDSQKFCTRDGGRLVVVETGSANFNPNATMVSGATPFDPNATMVSSPSNPNVSQPPFDPNATVISPPTPSPQPAPPIPASSSSSSSSSSYEEQQNFPTIAGVQIPQSQPSENSYSSQPNIPSTPYSPTADITTTHTQQRASGPLSQPVQVPMPARYDASSAPTSSDLTSPTNVSAPTSGDLGQTTVPPPSVPTDFGYTTGRSASSPAPPDNVNYPQTGSAQTSADLRLPEAAMDMQTQALVSPPSQSFKTSNTGELAKPVIAPPVATRMPAPPQAPAITAQPKKSSGKKMVLIGVGAMFFAVLIIVVGVGVFVITQHPEWIGMAGKTNNNENTNISNNENTNTTSNTNQSNSSDTNTNTNGNTNTNANENTNTNSTPPPNTVKFENSSSDVSGDLSTHFAPFSFFYPEDWVKTLNAKGYFVELIRKLPDGFPQEHFAVSYYDSKGTLDADRADFEKHVQKYSTELAKAIPGYQKVSEGETNINGVLGYEFRFRGQINDQTKGDVKFYGRTVFLPSGKDGDKNGVRLVMYGTSLAPELQNIDDFGIKGQLPVILSSFKLGQ